MQPLSKADEFKKFLDTMKSLDGEIGSYVQAFTKSAEYFNAHYDQYCVLSPKHILEDPDDVSLFDIQHSKKYSLNTLAKLPKLVKFVSNVIDQRRTQRNFSEEGIEKAKRNYVKLRFKKIHEKLMLSFWKVSTNLFREENVDEMICLNLSDGSENICENAKSYIESVIYWKGARKGKLMILSGPGVHISHKCEFHGSFRKGYAQGLGSVFNLQGKLVFQGFFDNGEKLMSFDDAKLYFARLKRVTKSSIRLKNELGKKVDCLKSKMEKEIKGHIFWTWLKFTERMEKNRRAFEGSPRHHFFVGRDTFIDILRESDTILTPLD